MKVFLSHQKADSALATKIATQLRINHSIESYLDVIDPTIGKGEDLARHIQVEMSKCSQLLAVISDATSHSWWVPWEIGVATEKDFPLATYSAGGGAPEYLKKWPLLRSSADLDRYAAASKKAHGEFLMNKTILGEGAARVRSTAEFFSSLRTMLGQQYR